MINKFLLLLRHAFALIRDDKLYSAIYIAGTAVAVASAMVVAIVFNILLADIPPEVHRSRTLYLLNTFINKSDMGSGFRSGCSLELIDSCFRQMKCVEAATGIYNTQTTFLAYTKDQQNRIPFYARVTDHEFFHLYEFRFLEGRPFSEKEFRDGERVAVISDKVADVLGAGEGSTVLFNEKPYHVVGVVKSVSVFLTESAADVYVPDSEVYYSQTPISDRSSASVSYSGNLAVRILLRKGCSRKDFLEELEPFRQHVMAVASTQIGEHVDWVIDVDTHFFNRVSFTRDGEQDLVHEAKNLITPAILMLLLLFLPAINLSGLVSNRMEGRRAEMGIRKAFGAKRRTLLSEVIHENLILTLCGGMVGWLLAWFVIYLIHDNKVFLRMFDFHSNAQSQLDTSLDISMFVTPTLFIIVFLCCAMLNLMAALIPSWTSLRKPIVESLNQKR